MKRKGIYLFDCFVLSCQAQKQNTLSSAVYTLLNVGEPDVLRLNLVSTNVLQALLTQTGCRVCCRQHTGTWRSGGVWREAGSYVLLCSLKLSADHTASLLESSEVWTSAEIHLSTGL